MFGEERQNTIVSMVNEKGKVRVKDLSELFQVTEDCIRKDLAALEKAGMLKRAYGGAVRIRITPHEVNVVQRKDKNIEAKRRIAEKALRLIRNDEMIYMDVSTANTELAKLLVSSGLKVTVVTNMIDVMLTLAVPDTKIHTVFIGGTFGPGKDGFMGCMSMEAISHFKFDKAFLGAVGVDLFDNSVSTYAAEDGMTKQSAIAVSKVIYLMLETRKFNTDGTFKYARADDFNGFIVEEKPAEDVLEALKDYSLEII